MAFLYYLFCLRGLVVKALDSQSRGPMFKIIWWLQGQFRLSSSEVSQMNTRNFWGLNGKR